MSERKALGRKILEKYMSHSSIGYQMGFSSVTRQDILEGHPPNKILNRLLKRIVAFEMPNSGYVVKDPDSISLTIGQYSFAAITLARWLPICLIQASGIHEPFVSLVLSESNLKRSLGKAGMLLLGEGFYWSGYLLTPGWCKDMNPNLPIGLENIDPLNLGGKGIRKDSWRTK